jgi:hypothetical protein
VSDTSQVESADLSEFREATKEEARRLFTDLQQKSPNESFYAFSLFDYVDWGCPCLFYAANTLQHWNAVLTKKSGAAADLPDEYYKWCAGEWKCNGNLGSISVVEEIMAKTGLEGSDDYDAVSELRLSIEVEMILALRELDTEGFFGKGTKRNGVLLTVSTEDEGAADDWRHEISAFLLNSDDTFRKFLIEFRRGNRQKLPDIDTYVQELRDTDIAGRFLERLAS